MSMNFGNTQSQWPNIVTVRNHMEWMHKRTACMRIGKDLYSVEITAKKMKNTK